MKILIEDDRSLRLLQVVLDPAVDPQRRMAFADYIRHDISLGEAIAALKVQAPSLFPADVVLVRDQGDLQAAIGDAAVVIAESLEITSANIAAAPRLRAVVKFGALPDGIDTDACHARGIHVIMQRRRTNIAVAEHAMAMLMALAKQLPRINGLVTPGRLAKDHPPLAPYDTRHTPNANWGRIGGLRLLSDMTLGILGMGEIGSEMARMARACGMSVLYNRRIQLSPEIEDQRGIAFRDLESLLRESDALSIHLPMNDGTRGLVDARRLALMKPGALLVNTARAEIVDRQALIDALDRGHLAGAGLDVLHSEPADENDPLLDRPNVILTPHLAGGSRINRFRDFAEMLSGIEAALR